MSSIKNAWLGPLENPKYLEPFAIKFDINGHKKTWELAKTHDSVAILIYNTSRNVFVFVRQFRPAVFVKSEAAQSVPWTPETVPENEYSTEHGLTYELCAGIIDRTEPPENIAAAEVFEETGYRIGVDKLNLITRVVNGVGTSGERQHMFYTEVTDKQRETQGGGLAEEGEVVEVIEVARDEIETFAFDESKPKPPGCILAIVWWLNQHKSKE